MDKLRKVLAGNDDDEEQGIVTQVYELTQLNIGLRLWVWLWLRACVAGLFSEVLIGIEANRQSCSNRSSYLCINV